MSLNFEWRDKQDGVDDILSEDINSIAHSVIENEEKILELDSKTAEHGKKIESNELEILGLKEKDEDIFEKISSKIDFVDVDVLPTENIQEGCIYRIRKARGVYYLKDDSDVTPWEATAKCTIHYVDTLPEIGIKHQVGSLIEASILHFYKKKGDNEWLYYQSDSGNWYWNPYAIFESIEEAKNNGHGFVPESTECNLYVADKSDPFNVRWVHLNKKAVSNVTTLPMDDIDEDGFYKTSENFASTYIKRKDGSIEVDSFGGVLVTFHVVDELPTQGELAVDNAESPAGFIGCYCRSDKMSYVYYDSDEGVYSWIPLQEFLDSFYPDATWKEIQSVDEVTDINVLYIRLNKNAIFHYDGEWHELVDKAELDGKLDKVTDTYWAQRLYGVDTAGNQILHNLRWQADSYSVAQRGDNGTLYVGTPTLKPHAVSLGYANEHYVQVQGGTGGNRVYGVNPRGEQTVFPAASSLYAWSVPLRDDNFTFQVGEPTQDAHPATKKYVDTQLSAVARHPRVYIDWVKDIESQFWIEDDGEVYEENRGTYIFGEGRYDVYAGFDTDATKGVATFEPFCFLTNPDFDTDDFNLNQITVTGDTNAVSVYVDRNCSDFTYCPVMSFNRTTDAMPEHFLLDIEEYKREGRVQLLIHVRHIVL